MKTKELSLAITKTYSLEKPAEVIAMAKTLKSYVIQQKLYANIKGKNYAMVEGWMFAGFLTGLNVMVEEPKNLSNGPEIKYSATAKLFSGEKVVGVGYALCSSKEATKKGFDEYAILSMAQTRSIGKAFRNKIGWVMKLAGYEGTPSEEMHKVGETPSVPVEPVINSDTGLPDIKNALLCSSCDTIVPKVVADYSTKVYKKILCRDCQKDVKKK